MVGTFISKYLLVTTSTITVTSSAAVTFFVAKHLKVGKGYEKAMDYIKSEYTAISKVIANKENDEGRILETIDGFVKIFKKNCPSDSADRCLEELKFLESYYIKQVKKLISSWDSRDLRQKKEQLESILDVAGISLDDYD